MICQDICPGGWKFGLTCKMLQKICKIFLHSPTTPGSDVNAKQKCTICLGKSLQPKPRSTMSHFEYFAYFALTVFVTVGVED